jgi:hypothetical protein
MSLTHSPTHFRDLWRQHTTIHAESTDSDESDSDEFVSQSDGSSGRPHLTSDSGSASASVSDVTNIPRSAIDFSKFSRDVRETIFSKFPENDNPLKQFSGVTSGFRVTNATRNVSAPYFTHVTVSYAELGYLLLYINQHRYTTTSADYTKYRLTLVDTLYGRPRVGWEDEYSSFLSDTQIHNVNVRIYDALFVKPSDLSRYSDSELFRHIDTFLCTLQDLSGGFTDDRVIEYDSQYEKILKVRRENIIKHCGALEALRVFGVLIQTSIPSHVDIEDYGDYILNNAKCLFKALNEFGHKENFKVVLLFRDKCVEAFYGEALNDKDTHMSVRCDSQMVGTTDGETVGNDFLKEHARPSVTRVIH